MYSVGDVMEYFIGRIRVWWHRLMIKYFDREVDMRLVVVEGMGDLSDYPDFANAYVESAYWIHSEDDLLDHEYEAISDDSIYEMALEWYL